MIASLLRQNDAVTKFWHNNDANNHVSTRYVYDWHLKDTTNSKESYVQHL